MRILLIGAGGQLAEDLHQVLAGEEIAAVSHAGLDLEIGPPWNSM
jgi:dTDP-4-dehydrorhamnose reductase